MSTEERNSPTPEGVSDPVSTALSGDDDGRTTPAEGRFLSTTSEGEPKKRKSYRPAKKDIQSYPFTDEQIVEIAEFVKENPTLYDKANRHYANPKMKEDLWRQLAARFEECTYLQVRKFYEARRTDYGRIEKREAKSGASARDRTAREKSIMETWWFLKGHIAHEPSQQSEAFPKGTDDEVKGNSSSGCSDVSGSSSIRRKRMRLRQQQNQPVVMVNQKDDAFYTSALKELFQRAEQFYKKPPELHGKERVVQNFCSYLATRMMHVPYTHLSKLHGKMLEMVTAVEEPPDERTSSSNLHDLLDGLQASTSSASSTSSMCQPQYLYPHGPVDTPMYAPTSVSSAGSVFHQPLPTFTASTTTVGGMPGLRTSNRRKATDPKEDVPPLKKEKISKAMGAKEDEEKDDVAKGKNCSTEEVHEGEQNKETDCDHADNEEEDEPKETKEEAEGMETVAGSQAEIGEGKRVPTKVSVEHCKS